MIYGIEKYPHLLQRLEQEIRRTKVLCCGRKAKILRKYSMQLQVLQERDKLRKRR